MGPFLLVLMSCASPEREPRPTPELPTGRVDVVEHGLVSCADPAKRERRATWLADLGPDWERQRPSTLLPGEALDPGAGLAVADFTGDGRLDIFLPNFNRSQLFVQKRDGTLVDQTWRLPPEAPESGGWGASAADYDQDGDLDLYVSRHKFADQLLRNDDGRFVDVSVEAGLLDVTCVSRSASWSDIDGDGDLDLFVARHGTRRIPSVDCPRAPTPEDWRRPTADPNTLYENLGDGTFRDRTEGLDFDAVHGHGFLGGFHDVDADGDPDLYMVNDYGGRAAVTTLYENDGGGEFTRFDPSSGVELRATMMGLGAGDVNEDGVPDFALSQIGALHLMMSTSRGWYDNALAAGLRVRGEQDSAWGLELVDIDNDADLDLLVAFGPTDGQIKNEVEGKRLQPDGLFIQGAAGHFVDRASEYGLDQTSVGRGVVVLDWDGNGWLDVLRTDFHTGPATLHLQRCGEASWLAVDFEGENHGYGAVVKVRFGDRELTRWNVPSNTGLGSSAPSMVHFGLGKYDVVDELTVIWPDGREQTVEDVRARQRITLLQSKAK